jgi:hypothetical protein
LLDLSFDFNASFYVIVLGSGSSVGFALCNLLKLHRIHFVEVREQIHFDLRGPQIYEILGKIQCEILIVDLYTMGDFSVSGMIDSFAEERGAPVLRLTKRIVNGTSAKQIRVPRIFGAYYDTPGTDCVNQKYLHCVRNETSKTECEVSKTYALATDVAGSLLSEVRNYIQTHQLDREAHIWGDTYEAADILASMHSAFPKCRFHGQGNRSVSLDALNELALQLIPNSTAPYISHVTTVSDMPRVVKSYQLNLNTIAEAIHRFPLVSVEFICVFAPSANVSFLELYHVPAILRDRLRVIFIRPAVQAAIKQRYGTSFFPEYVLRNIGLRHARGTYVFCGSSDVVVPPGFYAAAERRLLSPLSYVRSSRASVDIVNASEIVSDFQDHMFATFHWASDDLGYEWVSNALLTFACGDFQGAHRTMWDAINGAIEGKEIFHVDSAIAMDMNSFVTPLLVRYLPGEKHIRHIKISTFTPHLTVFGLLSRGFMYNHFPSRFLYPRPNWGMLD